MESHKSIAEVLAAAFLAGELNVEELVERGSLVMGKRWTWLRPVAESVVIRFSGKVRPRQEAVRNCILNHHDFSVACRKHLLRVSDLLVGTSAMYPVDPARAWRLPVIRTTGELADWLSVPVNQLQWFADLKSLEYKQNKVRLRHYHYRPLTKGSGQFRLIELPKPQLKRIQRQLLGGLLDHIPPHPAVHGFRRGRSIRSFAEPHVGKLVVLRLDLRNFFTSIPVRRIQKLFRTVGYPEVVADQLAGLCCNSTPNDVWQDEVVRSLGSLAWETRKLYSKPHLPQGAPTSPAMANLCAYRLDCRLSGLATSAGATYTRYADDLAFSGDLDFERIVHRFQRHVCATVLEEQFFVNHQKTRLMRRGVRQHLAGLVVNEALGIPRADFDQLKAILTNCLRHGSESQNRKGHADFRGHLKGRISFVEMVNPTKGLRLRELFEQIVWDKPA